MNWPASHIVNRKAFQRIVQNGRLHWQKSVDQGGILAKEKKGVFQARSTSLGGKEWQGSLSSRLPHQHQHQCVCVCVSAHVCVCVFVPQWCPTLCDPMNCGQPVLWLLYPWNSPGKNTGARCHSLLQGIFPTQECNSCLPHCRQILYHLSHQGSLTPLAVIRKFQIDSFKCHISLKS